MNLCRIVYSFVARGAGPQVWLRIPLNNQTTLSDPEGRSDTWDWWHDFRANANYEKRLGLALELDENPPDETRLQRWLGEPVKAIVVNTRLYLTNKKGYPVLPRSVQQTVRRFIPMNIQVIVEGHSRGHDMRHYQSYLDHMWQQTDTNDPIKQFAKGYEDFLQSPLQPLMDNLESGTYEVFEKDPVKYSEYQQAIYKAILDKVPKEEADKKVLTLMVLGAGRGPLVRASLQAAELACRKIHVYAVEKNPNAIVTLLTQKEEDWKDRVDVVSSDMRKWNPKESEKADIIISELLGSFGDNELSPECLYSAQHLFKKDAVSIPLSYTSWVGLYPSRIFFAKYFCGLIFCMCVCSRFF